MGGVLVLHTVDLGSNPGISYGLLSTTRSNFWVQSALNPEPCSVAQYKEKNDKIKLCHENVNITVLILGKQQYNVY